MVTRTYMPLFVVFSLFSACAAHAESESESVFDSVVVGAFAHEISQDEEGGVDGNVELRLRPLFGRDWAIEILPTLGGTVNFGGDTSTAYAGATARYRFAESFFVEGFFGFAIHDADTPTDANGLGLGCKVLFREGAGLGYLSGPHSLGIYVSHASHGDILCDADENDGMTSVGLRYGYHF